MKTKWLIIGGAVIAWFLFFRGKDIKKNTVKAVKTGEIFTPTTRVVSPQEAQKLAYEYVYGNITELEADNIKRIMNEAGWFINEGGKAEKI